MKSPLVNVAGDGGIAVIVGAAEIAVIGVVLGISLVVADRGRDPPGEKR